MEPWIQPVMSALGTVLVVIGGKIAAELTKIREGQNELNLKLAVVIEQVQSHDKRISKLEGEI